MLCAILGADGNTENDRHSKKACGHGLPFSQLVEYFVACAAYEVAVHKFDNRTTACHCITNGGTNDSGLGNRGVEQSVIRKSLGKASVYGVSAAPITNVFTVSDERRVFVESVYDCFKQSVTNLEYLVLGNGFAVFVKCKTLFSCDSLNTRVIGKSHTNFGFSVIELFNVLVGKHDLFNLIGNREEIHSRRDLFINRHLCDLGDKVFNFAVDSGERVFLCDFRFNEFVAVTFKNILLFPSLDFFRSSVRTGVGGRVTGVSVSNGVEKYGTLVLFDKSDLSSHCVDNGKRIVTVDTLCVHLVGIDPRAGSYEQTAPRHRFAAGLTAHAVEVVEEVEDNGKSALICFVPKFGELVHGGEHHCFPNRTASHGAVADVGDADTVLLIDFLEERRACRDGCGAAYDGVVRVNAEREEESVHRTAETLVEAGLSCKDFSKSAVNEEVDGKFFGGFLIFFNDLQNSAAHEVLHVVVKIAVGKFVDGGHTFCKDFAVASVRTEDVVVNAEQVSLTYRRRFLTHGKVCRAGVGILDTVVF